MEVRLALIPTQPISIASGARQESALFRPGAQVIAKVLGQASPGRLLLEIGGHRLTAETELNIRAGTHLQLEVVQTQPKVELKVLADSSPAAILASTLRHALPRQLPLAEALSSLKALAQQNLAPSLRTQIEALLHSLPERTALAQPDQLALAVRLSGLFHEALTASSTPIPYPDLKARLRALTTAPPNPSSNPGQPLAAAVQPNDLRGEMHSGVATAPNLPSTPPQTPAIGPSPTAPASDTLEPATESPRPQDDSLDELRHTSSAGLARIVLNQLASLPKPDTPVLTWHLEIPFREGKRLASLRLTIAGEPPTQSKERAPLPWTAELEIEPPELGRIRAKLVLQGEKISAYFRGETEATVRLLERHLGALAERFHAAGLSAGELQAAVATGQDLRPTPPLPIAGPLLDETA
ncbi:hypothetical protein JCM13664_13990 [Methylothermus subterraneus]